MSHIHEFFDARLFSIHPETLRIRAFVPYDAILDYHGRIANVPQDVDRAALAHHYEMFCIESMAANMPLPELTTLTSGTNSPFTARSDLPATPGPDTSGDPSKRTRIIPVASEKGPDLVAQYHQDGDTEDAEDAKYMRETCFDRHITPLNSQQFLADVNFELGKLIDYEK
ncbi:uncharacterized protein LW94_12746 [Fusarium fujikuroi]|nr:uncharacterized protein LW94_12746 [Fusarium fujikuroi]SCN70532.1 uncharacterized protein FFE2_02028 [Fusarium fujikuroi]SCO57284.1 uncharacterized protein FFMR_14440 [Fusarium fujikuroi]SCV54741.1 uncharacterized protein FFFS_11416 [Fusarium fujikuroi]